MPIPDKTLERLKPCIIALLLTLMTVVGIMAQSSGDYGGGSTQPSPGLKFVGAGSTTVGVTGNVVTVSSSGGGGGSAAAALTNGANYFTSASYNTFNAGTLFNGITTNAFSSFLQSTYNEYGSTLGSTNRFYGMVLMNTNAFNTGVHYMNFVAPNTLASWANFNVGGGANNTSLSVGDYYNVSGGGSSYGRVSWTSAGFAIYAQAPSTLNLILGANNSDQMLFNGSAQTITMQPDGGTPMYTATTTLSTFGNSSSSAETHNGQTFTYAHLASFNSDVLRIGPSGSVLTNGTSFVTLGTYNGVTPGNMLTNLASSADSAITWSAQGTRIMTPSLAGFVATNGSTANAGNYTNYSGANLRSTTTYTTGLVYTVAASDWCVGSIDTGQTVRIMLPTSGHTGRTLRIFKTNESGFSTIIDAGAGNNINGFTNLILNIKYAPVDLIYTGTEWIAK